MSLLLLPLDNINDIILQCNDYDDITNFLSINKLLNTLDSNGLWIRVFKQQQFDDEMFTIGTQSIKSVCRYCFHITLLKSIFNNHDSIRFWFTTSGLTVGNGKELDCAKYYLSLPHLTRLTIRVTNFNVIIPSVLNQHPTLDKIHILKRAAVN